MTLEGQYNTITMDQVVSSCKQRLRIGDTSDDDLFLLRYANEGARHFDSLQTFLIRECTLDVTNGKAKLPNGFYQLLAFRISGCVYADQTFLSSCGYGNNGWRNCKDFCIIQNGYITFPISSYTPNGGFNPIIAPPPTPVFPPPPVPLNTYKIDVAFVGMNVCDDGMMVVYSDMERGLVAYCVWMYMLDAPAGKYTPQQIEANHAIWVNQKSWYKSIQFQNNFRNTRRAVASVASAWIVRKSWSI